MQGLFFVDKKKLNNCKKQFEKIFITEPAGEKAFVHI